MQTSDNWQSVRTERLLEKSRCAQGQRKNIKKRKQRFIFKQRVSCPQPSPPIGKCTRTHAIATTNARIVYRFCVFTIRRFPYWHSSNKSEIEIYETILRMESDGARFNSLMKLANNENDTFEMDTSAGDENFNLSKIKVTVGIDEDLRMILEMDPSIVDLGVDVIGCTPAAITQSPCITPRTYGLPPITGGYVVSTVIRALVEESMYVMEWAHSRK